MSAPVLSWLFITQSKNGSVNPHIMRSPGSSLVRSAVKQSCPSRPPFVPMTSTPNPQSQSLSRGYGSILPTSLIYIVLSTRGCTPWRPEAVMSTTRGANKSRHWVFKGRRERTGRHEKDVAFPVSKPYRRSIRFQGLPSC